MEISFPEDGNQKTFLLEEGSYWYRQRRKLIVDVLKTYISKGTFADVGGGNGFMLQGIADGIAGLTPILIEPGPQGCDNGRRRGLPEVFQGTLAEYNKRSQFDNLSLFDVLEHIENDQAFLKEVSERLIVGGTLTITVPAYRFLWSFEDEFAGHFHRYTRKELVEKLSVAGFQVNYATYFFATLIPLILIFRSIPYKLGNRSQSNPNVDHGESLLTRIVEWSLIWETRLLHTLGSFFLGSSILIVCTKNKKY